MSAPAVVTREHLERAYAQTRKPGWPSLDELREHWHHFSVIRAQAQQIANGNPLPAAPVSPVIPAAQAKSVQTPAPQHKRRRDDGAPAYSTQLAASGEYARHDTD